MLIVLHLCSYISFVIGALEMFYDDDDDDDDTGPRGPGTSWEFIPSNFVTT